MPDLDYVNFFERRQGEFRRLLARNVNPKIVSAMLGHATIGITLDTYSHVLPNMRNVAAKRLWKRPFHRLLLPHCCQNSRLRDRALFAIGEKSGRLQGFIVSRGGGTRTHTTLRPPDFKSECVSLGTSYPSMWLR